MITVRKPNEADISSNLSCHEGHVFNPVHFVFIDPVFFTWDTFNQGDQYFSSIHLPGILKTCLIFFTESPDRSLDCLD